MFTAIGIIGFVLTLNLWANHYYYTRSRNGGDNESFYDVVAYSLTLISFTLLAIFALLVWMFWSSPSWSQ
jgi:hypothetical protein